MILCWTACSNLLIKFSDLPSLTPLAFLAWSDCLVLWLINPASYSAMLLMICRINLLACGKSQNTISTSLSNSLEVNATFLDSLSNLATIRIELVFLHIAKAARSWGLLDFFPLSVSMYSASIGWFFTWLCIISRCASTPRPEICCFMVDCLRYAMYVFIIHNY